MSVTNNNITSDRDDDGHDDNNDEDVYSKCQVCLTRQKLDHGMVSVQDDPHKKYPQQKLEEGEQQGNSTSEEQQDSNNTQRPQQHQQYHHAKAKAKATKTTTTSNPTRKLGQKVTFHPIICTNCQSKQMHLQLKEMVHDWTMLASTATTVTATADDVGGQYHERQKTCDEGEKASSTTVYPQKKRRKRVEYDERHSEEEDEKTPIIATATTLPSMECIELAARLSAFDSFLFMANDTVADDPVGDGSAGVVANVGGGADCDADGVVVANKAAEKEEVTKEAVAKEAMTDTSEPAVSNERVLQTLLQQQKELRNLPRIRRMLPSTTTTTTNNNRVTGPPWQEMIVRTIPGSSQEWKELSGCLSAFDDFMFLVDDER